MILVFCALKLRGFTGFWPQKVFASSVTCRCEADHRACIELSWAQCPDANNPAFCAGQVPTERHAFLGTCTVPFGSAFDGCYHVPGFSSRIKFARISTFHRSPVSPSRSKRRNCQHSRCLEGELSSFLSSLILRIWGGDCVQRKSHKASRTSGIRATKPTLPTCSAQELHRVRLVVLLRALVQHPTSVRSLGGGLHPNPFFESLLQQACRRSSPA